MRILKAAARLIRQHGHARSAAEAANMQGCRAASSCTHFPIKDSLVVATLQFVFEQAQAVRGKRASSVNRPRDPRL